jgi:hypothetical protein
MNQNGKHGSVAIVDTIEDQTRANERTPFFDESDPVLQPPKEVETRRGGGWKRKLIGWSFVLFLLIGGMIALYLLLRVNRVNVRVQADSQRENQTAKAKSDASNSENAVTAEAINIAREAAGLDNGTSRPAIVAASPNASPSPAYQYTTGPNLSFTANSSPATDRIDDGSSKGNGSQQQPNTANEPMKSTQMSAPVVLQSHANATQSIYVEDLLPKTGSERNVMPQLRNDKLLLAAVAPKPSPAVLPPFGTMLPVRTQGVVFTMRNNSYARLELTRDCAGTGWSLPKGTILVGRTSGSESDRAFINVIGYIDLRDNKLVKMTGDVLGADGATGIQGQRMGVDRNRLKQTLRKIAAGGVQIAGTMAGALTGRGTVVIDSAGYRLMNPLTNDARGMIAGNNERNSFVKVEAGRAAYVMVADLPKSLQAVDAPGDDELTQLARSLSDREVMELILFGSPDELRAALPLMNDEQRRLVIKTQPEINKQ